MSSPSQNHLRLSEFDGLTAKVVSFDLPEGESSRLKSMGIFAGQTIELRKAGDPLILSAAGCRVAIAADVARQIVVQATDHKAA